MTLAIAFVGANLLLYGAQGLLAKEDTERARRMELRLDSLHVAIVETAQSLVDKRRALAQRDSAIEAYETRRSPIRSGNPVRRAPRRRVSEPTPGTPIVRPEIPFERQLAEMRSDQRESALADIAAAAERHETLVGEYELLVADYARVAEDAYGRWWLLPLPAPRRPARVFPPVERLEEGE